MRSQSRAFGTNSPLKMGRISTSCTSRSLSGLSTSSFLGTSLYRVLTFTDYQFATTMVIPTRSSETPNPDVWPQYRIAHYSTAASSDDSLGLGPGISADSAFICDALYMSDVVRTSIVMIVTTESVPEIPGSAWDVQKNIESCVTL